MSIGKNIAKFRKQLNLTQEELGEKLGVTNQAVSKWESAVSMPDVMLLPKIAEALNITLEELYGIAKEGKKALVGADGFPTYCHEKLHELFFVNARMKFGGVDNSDEAQLEFQKQKLKSGCRVGCFSNTKGVFVLTDDFAFIDCDFKESGSEDIIGKHSADDYTLIYLTDNNLRKVLFYQYKTAIKSRKVLIRNLHSRKLCVNVILPKPKQLWRCVCCAIFKSMNHIQTVRLKRKNIF